MPSPLPSHKVTTPYGVPGSWAAGYHTGEDYSTHGTTGVRVVATRTGKVVGTGNVWGSDYGTQVVVESDGVRHGYCHLSSVSVSKGQTVNAGDKVGGSGNTGNSTGPHLHYEERTSPYAYANHRRPQFSTGTTPSTGDDDVPNYLSLSGKKMSLPDDGQWRSITFDTENSDAGDAHQDGAYPSLLIGGSRYVGMLTLKSVTRQNSAQSNATVMVRWAEFDGDNKQTGATSPHEYVLSTGGTSLRDDVVDTCGDKRKIRCQVIAIGGALTIEGTGLRVLYWAK